jgi:ATP-dependent DNA helicase RecG
MEREGSGFDLMYNVLPSGERPAPVLEEGADSVRVTVQGSQLKPELARPIAKAGARSQRTQRERVAVGVLAQSDAIHAGLGAGIGALAPKRRALSEEVNRNFRG